VNEVGYEQVVCIGAGHPVLPGHFPGQPLVPGVLLLEQVALALRAWRGQRLARVLEAKFLAPLLPEQVAVLRLTNAAGARVRFEIQRDGNLLARGLVEGAA
jgi:3-hydroxymyristoyl/3-hydroxydecanoyl-(acyl carrier protein) dehydratase